MGIPRALGSIGVALSFAIGILCFARPDIIENRAHSFLSAQVEQRLAELPWYKPTPEHRSNVRQAIADACRHCSSQPPLRLDRDDIPLEVGVANRLYVGALLDVFISILALLAANSFFLTLATAALWSQSKHLPGTLLILTITLLAEASAVGTYFIFPSTFYWLLVRTSFDLAFAWGTMLAVLGASCFAISWRTSKRSESRLHASRPTSC